MCHSVPSNAAWKPIHAPNPFHSLCCPYLHLGPALYMHSNTTSPSYLHFLYCTWHTTWFHTCIYHGLVLFNEVPANVHSPSPSGPTVSYWTQSSLCYLDYHLSCMPFTDSPSGCGSLFTVLVASSSEQKFFILTKTSALFSFKHFAYSIFAF